MGALDEHDQIQLSFSEKYRLKKRTKAEYRVYFDMVVEGVRKEFVYGYGEQYSKVRELVDVSGAPTAIDLPAFDVKWEVPVPGRYEPVGYLDLLITPLHYQAVMCHDDDIHLMKNGGEFCLEQGHWSHSLNPVRGDDPAAVEIKSYVNSIGDLMRQINKYKSALPWCYCPYRYGEKVHLKTPDHFTPKFWVVSPDSRFEDVLGSQGVKFKIWPEVA